MIDVDAVPILTDPLTDEVAAAVDAVPIQIAPLADPLVDEAAAISNRTALPAVAEEVSPFPPGMILPIIKFTI